MAVRFHSSGDAILSYCTLFSMYITLWSMEQQSDTLLLLLYYSDFFYLAQYVCVKLSQSWLDCTTCQESGEISLAESLPFITTPISLLPFHVVFKIGLDRGCFYQFVCFLRLFSLYQDGRIHMDDEEHRNRSNLNHREIVQLTRRSPHNLSQPEVQMECLCKCRFPSEDFKESDSGNS